jgi:hypothetical protein
LFASGYSRFAIRSYLRHFVAWYGALGAPPLLSLSQKRPFEAFFNYFLVAISNNIAKKSLC